MYEFYASAEITLAKDLINKSRNQNSFIKIIKMEELYIM